VGGVNFQEENGMIVFEKKQMEKNWVVEIKILADLIKFQEKYIEFIIFDSSLYDVKKRNFYFESKIKEGKHE